MVHPHNWLHRTVDVFGARLLAKRGGRCTAHAERGLETPSVHVPHLQPTTRGCTMTTLHAITVMVVLFGALALWTGVLVYIADHGEREES